MLARFYEEGRKTARLKHQHIVTVYDLGEENGIPYIVMERVEGASLEKLIRDESPLTMMDRMRIIAEMCTALGYAHANNVIHRDVKPANIFVQPDGNAKLLDFGIARLERRSQELSLTRTGHIVGTVPYIAPERLKDKFIDGRSDIFSIGVVLYQLICGQLPFTGEDFVLMQKIMSEPHAPVRALNPDAPLGVGEIVDRALAKLPDDRYQSAEEMADDLETVMSDLRQQEVLDLVPKARTLMESRDLTRARVLLQQVLKVQSKNVEARELLSEVQRQLVRRQRDERLEQIRHQAEESLKMRDFEQGMSVVNEGLQLDSQNIQLLALRDKLQEEKNARSRSTTSSAPSTVPAAKAITRPPSPPPRKPSRSTRPTPSSSLSATPSLLKPNKPSARPKPVSYLTTPAASCRAAASTAPSKSLPCVEELSPAEPELQMLRADATAGFEQNVRKGTISRLEEQVSIANTLEQLQLCSREIREALATMASEPALVRLNMQVDRRLRDFEKTRLVDDTIQSCRDLRPRDALDLVLRARQQLPTDERLLALEARLKERLAQLTSEERRAEYLSSAHDALKSSRYHDAVRILEACQAQSLGNDEVTALLEYARAEEVEHTRELHKRSTFESAQNLINEGDYDQAIQFLQSVLVQSEDSTLLSVCFSIKPPPRAPASSGRSRLPSAPPPASWPPTDPTCRSLAQISPQRRPAFPARRRRHPPPRRRKRPRPLSPPRPRLRPSRLRPSCQPHHRPARGRRHPRSLRLLRAGPRLRLQTRLSHLTSARLSLRLSFAPRQYTSVPRPCDMLLVASAGYQELPTAGRLDPYKSTFLLHRRNCY